MRCVSWPEPGRDFQLIKNTGPIVLLKPDVLSFIISNQLQNSTQKVYFDLFFCPIVDE
jgi:hypothetical protein